MVSGAMTKNPLTSTIAFAVLVAVGVIIHLRHLYNELRKGPHRSL
jgi:hypothetical protein